MSPRITAALALSAALLATGTASAHPTALTSVTIRVDQAAVDVTIATDVDALRMTLAAMQRTIDDCIDLRVDGVRVALVGVDAGQGVEFVSDANAGGGQSVRSARHFRARLPSGAARLTWSSTFIYGSYPVIFQRADDDRDTTVWLQGPETSAPFVVGAATPTPFAGRFAHAVGLGYTHILPNGLDHILFVLGLFLLTRRIGAVLAQVTAFTLAHSITLGLTLYGVVSVPPSLVEPLIALSIAYVAFENLATTDLKPWRLALVFAFGLLHGMGFAEALARLDLPRSEFLTTLVGFNGGVESGQLTIIALASAMVSLGALPPDRYRRLVARPASALIGAAGVLWTIQRL